MTKHTDILIIGGGSIGLNCAYYLQKAGRNVTLVESDRVGIGSSSGNAGHIVPSHIVPLAAPGVIGSTIKWMLHPKTSPFSMRFSLNPQYLAWLVNFSLACSKKNVQRALEPLYNLGKLSTNNFKKILEKEEFDCSHQAKGLLFLFTTDRGFADGRHEADIVRDHDIPVSILDNSTLREIEPSVRQKVVGGVLYSGDSNLNPGLFLKQLKEHIQSMGAEIYEQSPVTGFETGKGRIERIITRWGDFTAEEIVLAAGSWTPAVAQGLSLSIPIQPAKGYSLTAEIAEQKIRHALLLGERRVAVSPMGNLLRLTGRLELSRLDRTVDPTQIAGIEQAARDYLNLEEPLQVLETWAGLRPISPDGMPIIGRSSSYTNLTLATGHGMLGLSHGPGTGQLVAELVNNSKPAFTPTPFAPDRF